MRQFINMLQKLNEAIKDSPQFIENPNSSGQGKHPEYKNHPFHDILTKHEYRYSHSTPIKNQRENNYNIHHTYKHNDLKDNVVGIYKGGWEAHKLGHVRTTVGKTPESLDKFLRNHVKRATKRSTLGE